MSKLLITSSLLLAACTGTTAGIGTTSPQSVVVEANRDFTLKPGQTARVEGGALTISFVKVTEDSRCPVDVQCVWAGDAVVALNLADASGANSSAALHTTLTPKSVTVSSWEVTLIGVEPVKKQGVTIPVADYVATLRVSRR